MIKNKFLTIFACLALLSSLGAGPETAKDYADNIEVASGDINFSQTEFPRVAYLSVEFKNNGGQDIDNLNFLINYYDTEECLMKKVVMKDRLNKGIPAGKSQKYKMRLKGDVFNERNEQYPYTKADRVGDFDIKILNVKFAKKK